MSEEDKQSEADDVWAEALQEQADSKQDDEAAAAADAGQDEGGAGSQDVQDVEKAEFDEFDEESQPSETLGDSERNMDLILDVPVTVSMEVGSTQVPIRTLLQLSQGSVVELDRLAGEPLDVRVNGTLIAHGEVVVVNEKFGIRLTDVISPAERVRKLR